MRGDLTVLKTASITGLAVADRFVIDGNRIAASFGAGVAKRDSEKSFRVSLGSDAIRAIAGETEVKEIAVRFVMTIDKLDKGGRVYLMVPAGDKPAHGVIRTRA